MKVLLETSQLLEKRGDSYWCSSNFYDIVNRFHYLGELYIWAAKYNPKKSHLKMERDLKGLVENENVSFFYTSRTVLKMKDSHPVVTSVMGEVDLVISYGSSLNLFKLARHYNKKFMSFVVSCPWDAYWNHSWKGKVVAPFKFLRARYVIKNSDYVLYVSNSFLQKRYPTNAKYQVGCSNVKILDVDNNIISKRVAFLNSWDGKELHLVTTGAVDVAYKGQRFVIRALHELQKKGIENIHYHLLGGGNNGILANLAMQLGLESNVHFYGIVSHDDVFGILDKMHIYIQPSLQEGLPRSMVEAMSRGLLCIGANTAAIPELIPSKYVTRRKSVSDIVRILENVSRQELIEQARTNFNEAQKYQEDVIGKRRNEFFDKVKEDVLSNK